MAYSDKSTPIELKMSCSSYQTLKVEAKHFRSGLQESINKLTMSSKAFLLLSISKLLEIRKKIF